MWIDFYVSKRLFLFKQDRCVSNRLWGNKTNLELTKLRINISTVFMLRFALWSLFPAEHVWKERGWRFVPRDVPFPDDVMQREIIKICSHFLPSSEEETDAFMARGFCSGRKIFHSRLVLLVNISQHPVSIRMNDVLIGSGDFKTYEFGFCKESFLDSLILCINTIFLFACASELKQ